MAHQNEYTVTFASCINMGVALIYCRCMSITTSLELPATWVLLQRSLALTPAHVIYLGDVEKTMVNPVLSSATPHSMSRNVYLYAFCDLIWDEICTFTETRPFHSQAVCTAYQLPHLEHINSLQSTHKSLHRYSVCWFVFALLHFALNHFLPPVLPILLSQIKVAHGSRGHKNLATHFCWAAPLFDIHIHKAYCWSPFYEAIPFLIRAKKFQLVFINIHELLCHSLTMLPSHPRHVKTYQKLYQDYCTLKFYYYTRAPF